MMNKIRGKFCLALLLVALLTGCAAPHARIPQYWPTDGWRSTSPEEQGMDSEILAQMMEHIQQEGLDLHSLLIVRNGYLVSEVYGYPYSAEQPHWVASVTKPVVGALVGIAIEQGYIKDSREPLFRLLPDVNVSNLDDNKKALTLEDLLTLTTGLDCTDNPAPGEAFMEGSENWVEFMLNLPMVTQPGTDFNYCSGVVHVLSAVLQKMTGMSTLDYANQNLFSPIGIGPIPESRWPADPQDVTFGGYGLVLTPQEMAKFGYLILHQGTWEGKQIIPANWVRASITGHTQKDDGQGYGYLWTIDRQGNYYAALGRGGQHIFIYPEQNMVVVFTAGLLPWNNADLTPLQELLEQYILPALKSDRPLPANPEALTRFESAGRAFAQPSLIPSSLPAVATVISDKTFAIAENSFGWQTAVFSFQEGSDEALVTMNGEYQLAIGLDNVYRITDSGDNLFSEGLRGYWEDENTFIVKDILIGQMAELEYRIQFFEDTVRIIRREKYTGNEFEFEGTLQDK